MEEVILGITVFRKASTTIFAAKSLTVYNKIPAAKFIVS
jgi:hypothetical protein